MITKNLNTIYLFKSLKNVPFNIFFIINKVKIQTIFYVLDFIKFFRKGDKTKISK